LNFLSHYYLDSNQQNPHHTLGSLIPDIAPHFTHIYNQSIRSKAYNLPEPLASIHQGILRHYTVDAAFHNKAEFKTLCTIANQTMVAAGLNREVYRLFFVSHIAVEILLDRYLIARDSALIDSYYYSLLSTIHMEGLKLYLENIVSPSITSQILVNFERFKQVSFLYHIRTLEGAAEAIIRTLRKATGIELMRDDRAKLIIALYNIELEMRYKCENLLLI
jgi:hypothetical protein